jgi:tRNA G18 (ribose-2'-O)-methylase SpoU
MRHALSLSTLPPMARIPIDDPADPRLVHYQALNRQNLTRHSGLFVAEGDKVVDRLVASRFPVASLLAEPAVADRYEPLLPAVTPIYVAARAVLEQTIGFNFHRGVLACGRRLEPLSLAELLRSVPSRGDSAGSPSRSTLLICPEVHDPSNLGSIIRTAAAFGCQGLVLGRLCADPLSRRALRVSMGAALRLPMVESSDLAADLQLLAAEGYELVATVLDPRAEPLATARRAERLAILLGSEGHGLDEPLIELAHRRVTIPMQLGIDSLNVATAAAVFLYHFESLA